MSDIPTPETDANENPEYASVSADFARSLERRLAVAVEALQAISGSWGNVRSHAAKTLRRIDAMKEGR